jgi:2-succinyl-5-enolpyruvyl-6-hydroxy-3-cyclohexene-1-carboxylate synthase
MHYTVELRLPRTGWGDLQEAAARARQATEQMRREGKHVRFLRSIYVPEDDACFFLYEGSSARAVQAAVARAQLGAVRVDAALRLDLEGGQTS